MRHDDSYERAMREWLDRPPLFTSAGDTPYMKRDEIYAERLDRFR